MRQWVLSSMCLLALLLPVSTKSIAAGDAYGGQTHLFSVQDPGGDKYGLMNRQGKIVIGFQYDWVGGYNSGLALAEVEAGDPDNAKDNKLGYIDRLGQWAIKPRFALASPFNNGTAWAMDDYANDLSPSDIRFVVLRRTPQGIAASDPIEGNPMGSTAGEGRVVFFRETADGQRVAGVADRYGRIVVDAVAGNGISGISDYSQGLAVALTEEAGTFPRAGYIDRRGQWVIEPVFDRASVFHGGLAAVSPHESKGQSYIWPTGEMAFEETFIEAESFGEGLAAVELEIGETATYRFGFIDSVGEMKIEPRFIRTTPFTEGLAAVQVERHGQRVWGYINHVGEWVIRPRFDDADPFDHGLARAQLRDRTGYIDREGEWCWIDDRGWVGGSKDKNQETTRDPASP